MEFNRVGRNPLEIATTALLTAIPAIISFQQYGWTGLLIGGIAIAAWTAFISRNDNKPVKSHVANYDNLKDDLKNKTQYYSDFLRLDHTVRDLAPRFGLEDIRPVITDRKGSTAAAYSTNKLEMSYGLIRLLDDDELRWVVGHELAHLKNKDLKLKRVFDAAATIADAGFLGSVIAPLFGTSMNALSGFWPILFGTIALKLSFNFLSSHLYRTMEHNADIDALEFVPKNKAISALQKVEKFLQTQMGENNLRFHKHHDSIFDLIASHPSHERRITAIKDAKIDHSSRKPLGIAFDIARPFAFI
ncbi:MAG TPA: M48 family metallopeptidase [Alphaproteobacteria bacterium]